jgi:hypothetical protein
MTRQQRNSIQGLLDSFRSHKLHNQPDWRLELSARQSRPLEEVLKMYQRYTQTKSLTVVSQEFGINIKNLKKLFKRFNFKLFGTMTHRSPYQLGTKQPSSKTIDTLSLSYGDWNLKYDVKSKSLYYKQKKIAQNFVEQNL